MCGPHGLKFLRPVELRLPHRASVNPDSWSFALKSSDSPTGLFLFPSIFSAFGASTLLVVCQEEHHARKN